MGSGIGQRVVIVGPSSSGKSTLGERLAALIGVPFVELDGLFWKPGWEESRDEEFQAKLQPALAGEQWVAAGNYFRHMWPTIWRRAETIIWLDLPFRVSAGRIVRRSWRRWRNNEVLWGTNKERFWSQLKLWSKKDSLITYTWQQRKVVDERYSGAMSDPRWAHVRFVRLRSAAEVEAFVLSIAAAAG
jgi:adenylate kinase family enzyme